MDNKNSKTEFKRLMKMVTPSKMAHQKYLNEVDLFINSVGKINADKFPAKKFKILLSQVFNRSYLVAYVDNDYFNSIAYGCDVAASSSLNYFYLNSPPLVLIPVSKSRLKNKFFLSTLEHEFIHVNQGILGNFPTTSDFSKITISALMNYTFAEYQANYIQYCYFPEAYYEVIKQGYTLPVQNWSVLRGYTQALEKMVLAIYLGQLSSSAVGKLLKELPKQIPSEFYQLGLPEFLGVHYAVKLYSYLNIAVEQLIKNIPSTQTNKGFLTLTQQISTKLKINS